MALLHSTLVARVRHPAEGEEPYVIIAQATGGSGQGTVSTPVVAAYHQIMSSSPEAIEARRRYSHLVLIVDNGHRANHDFPDLDAVAAKQARTAEIRDAAEDKRQSESTAAALRKQLAEVESTQSKAAARLANLTGAPVDPVAAPGGEASDESGESGESAPSGPSSPADPSGTGTDSPIDSALAIAARLEAGEDIAPEDLAALTVDQLRQLGERYDIPMPSAAKKADLVELLLQKEPE